MEPCTQAEHPAFCSSMGLTHIAAGMDSTSLAASRELRLELDDEAENSSPVMAETNDDPLQRSPSTAAAAAADLQPEQPDHDVAQLSQEAQEQMQSVACSPASAAPGQGDTPMPTATVSEAPLRPGPKAPATSAWQTPLSSLRALLTARMHGRLSATETDCSQPTVAPTPSILRSVASLTAQHQGHDAMHTIDLNQDVAGMSSTSAEQPADQLAGLAGGLTGLESVIAAGEPSATLQDRPHKRRRTAREVVCDFFGLQDSDFAEPAA